MGLVVYGMLTLALIISFPSIDLSLLRDSFILTPEIVKNVDLTRNIVWNMLDGDIDNSYIVVVMTGTIITMAKGASVSESKAKDAGKNDAHGDSGRAKSKAEKQIAELEEQLKDATGNEAKKIKQKIKNIRDTAKGKGETHHRK